MIGRSPSLAEATAASMNAVGLYHDFFTSLEEADEAVRDGGYSAVVIEERLRDGNGIGWLKAQRGKGQLIPILLMITASKPEERAAVLDAGADDCMSMPANGTELVSRIRAILRRPRAVVSEVLVAGNARLETAARELWVEDQRVTVPRREMALLELLMRRFNRTVPRSALESDLYGHNDLVCPNSLEVRVSRVRRHLAYANANVTIQTIRGTGYMLTPVSGSAGVADPAEGRKPEAVILPPRVLNMIHV
jgi:DNA-binding response OmpR family regulator